jgi:hypothetical protein
MCNADSIFQGSEPRFRDAQKRSPTQVRRNNNDEKPLAQTSLVILIRLGGRVVLLYSPTYTCYLRYIPNYMMNRLLEFASPRAPRKGDESSPLSNSSARAVDTQVGTERSQGTDADAPNRSGDRIQGKNGYRPPAREYEEEYEERSGIDSDLDEQLTEFDESDVDSLADGDGEANQANLVRLTEESCRVPCNVKIAGSGKSVRSVCGKRADVCNRHQVKRSQGGRQSVGYYAPVLGVGSHIHGRLGNIFVPESQMKAKFTRDRKEMGDHLRAHEDDMDSDEEVELENLRRRQEPRKDTEVPRSSAKNVAFGGEETRSFPTIPSTSNPLPPSTQLRADDPRGLEIPFRGLAVQPKAREQPREKEVWVGMMDSEGHRQMVSGLPRALAFVNDLQWTIVRTFTGMQECGEWANQSPERQVQSPLPSRQERPQRSDAAARRQKYDADYAPTYHRSEIPNDRDSEPLRDSRPRDGQKKSKKGRRRKNRREKRRRRRSPSSSSSSSASSSSDSGGSYYRERKSSRRKKVSSSSESEQEPRRRGHSSKTQPVNTSGADVSKGQKNYVFDKDLTGLGIDKVIGPEGLSPKDATQLYDLAVDVASLPGMYISRPDNHADEEQVTATLLASAMNTKSHVHDSLWRTKSRHGLREAKDETSFFELVQEVGKAEKHAFENQEICLRGLLAKRHYAQRSVDSFIQHGLLLRITRDTFQWYKDLLNHCREIQYRHKGSWEGGPAQSMISHHSKEMAGIRMYAPSKKILILRMYTYLRDTKTKGFYDDSMNEAVWDRLASLTAKAEENLPVAEDKRKVATPACSHCRCQALHTLFGVSPYKRTCPLKDQGQTISRKIAVVVVRKHDEDPDADLQGLKDGIVRAWR